MDSPLFAATRKARSSVRTAATVAPIPKWAGAVFLSPAALLYFDGGNVSNLERNLRDSPPLMLALAGLVFLLATLTLGRWVHGLVLSFKHPYEPWLWERRWRSVLGDEQLRRVAEGLLLSAILLGFLFAFHWLAFTRGIGENLFLSILLIAFLLIGNTVCFLQVFRPTALATLSLLRFGRMRLRLPGIPLELGSQPEVYLVARPSLAALPEVKVKLQRVREWHETTGHGKQRQRRLITRTEFSREYTVDASDLREGRDLPIPLELPESRPENSTALYASRRCRWELELLSEVPGVDLETRFVLPVYFADGKYFSPES